VPMYPRPLETRFAAQLHSMRQRLTKVETRTAAIDSGFPLAALPAVIDSAYGGSGDPMAYINGAAALTGPYQHLAAYTPVAGDSVLALPVGALQTYIILGKVT